MISLFGSQSSADFEGTARVKEWVRQALKLDADTSILVSEVHCMEPGCMPVETVVALMGRPGDGIPITFKVPKPLSEIHLEDVVAGVTALNAES